MNKDELLELIQDKAKEVELAENESDAYFNDMEEAEEAYEGSLRELRQLQDELDELEDMLMGLEAEG